MIGINKFPKVFSSTVEPKTCKKERRSHVQSLRRREFLATTTLFTGLPSVSSSLEEKEGLDTIAQVQEVPVSLSMVASKNALPVKWYSDFQKLVGYKNKITLKTRPTIDNVYKDLEMGSLYQTDLITLGDAWLSPSISKKLIKPFESPRNYRWFQNLPNKWKYYVTRDFDGELSNLGKVWAVPFRWGLNVVVYRSKEIKKAGIDGISDWSDLTRTELANRVAWFNSPRDLAGLTLKSLGLSFNLGMKEIQKPYNNGNQSIQDVARKKVQAFIQNSLVFSNTDHVRALLSSDAWVCVGSSLDLLPLCQVVSDLKVIIPRSGTSIWADFFVIPSKIAEAAELKAAHMPSPLINALLDYSLSPARSRERASLGTGLSPLDLRYSDKVGPFKALSQVDVQVDVKQRFLPSSVLLQKSELPAPLNGNLRSVCETLLE